MSNNENIIVDAGFWSGKRVLLTGHTGFKGSWLALWLSSMGAKVVGYALATCSEPNLYDCANVNRYIAESYINDIRDLQKLTKCLYDCRPEIVIHMAAQPLVRRSYVDPIETYSTNVLGTSNLLEAIRLVGSVRSVVVVTSDKCYENNDRSLAFVESDAMGGADPYSSSKACAELVVSAYQQSFFSSHIAQTQDVRMATARAGNVIGGGDWSIDRLVPDAIRAFESGKTLALRNPSYVRPWQHVLEPLAGYLLLAQSLFIQGRNFIGGWNFGPEEADARSVAEVVNLLIKNGFNDGKWEVPSGCNPYEAAILRLDCTKAKTKLRWKQKWTLEEAIVKTIEWQKALRNGENMHQFTLSQIDDYTK